MAVKFIKVKQQGGDWVAILELHERYIAFDESSLMTRIESLEKRGEDTGQEQAALMAVRHAKEKRELRI